MAPEGFFAPQPSIRVSHAPTYLHNTQFDGKAEGARTSTSHLLGAAPAGEYTYRAPSPPHIHVPQAPDDKELVLAGYDNFQCNPQHRQILTQITQGNHHSIVQKDWKYEWRRKAQPMLGFLYLGPSSAARDIEALKVDGITMLLVIRDISMAQAKFLSGEKIASQLGIDAEAIDVTGNAQLIAAFPRAVERINDHLVQVYQHRVQAGISPGEPAAIGKVLVFCESGNERSATVVAAYLMHMYDIDEVAAIQYMQSQRFCVAFDDGLKHLLRSYHDILQARKCVGQATVQPRIVSGNKPKRGRDDMDTDMETDPERQDDEERFGKRSVFTPFRDLSC